MAGRRSSHFGNDDDDDYYCYYGKEMIGVGSLFGLSNSKPVHQSTSGVHAILLLMLLVANGKWWRNSSFSVRRQVYSFCSVG